MPRRVLVRVDGESYELIVCRVVVDEGVARLEGLPPSLYPTPVADVVTFAPNGLVALVSPDDPITILQITPTDKSVPSNATSF